MKIIKNSFRGGIHLNDKKASSRKVDIAELPTKVVIPLHQHIGTPSRPIVEVGSEVRKGQKIGEATGFVSANVHASISGKIANISRHLYPALGRQSMAIVIESNGVDEWSEEIQPYDPDLLDNKQILNRIFESGIVGMGGAAFPTHVKLSIPEGKEIDTIILNGAECEPYITSDHALMLDEPAKIIDGLKIIKRLVGAKNVLIGIEQNKPDALEIISKLAGKENNIQVVPLKVKYPQGWENMLIKNAINREVPPSKLPLDAGIIVSNVSTAHAISNAVRCGYPLIERVVSITGSGISQPKNIRARIGTLFSDLIRQCGGFIEHPSKIIAGGPMMGFSMSDTNIPIVKGTNNILVLSAKEAKSYESRACIRCGRCIDVCPVGLMPRMIALLAEKGNFKETEKYYPTDCKECGCCAYSCPAKIPLVQLIQFAKTDIMNRQRLAKAK